MEVATDTCPECEHVRDPEARPAMGARIARLLGRLPKVTCTAAGAPSSGWYDPCHCAHPFHGE